MDASSEFQDSLPVSSDALIAELNAAGVAFTSYTHIPLRTVEDAKTVQGPIVPDGPGHAQIKNLYLRDRKKRNYLVVLEQDRAVDLKALGQSIGAPGLSFGSADRLMEYLGIRPGAVSPLAMVNGATSGVQLFIDASLREADVIHAHPLVNDRTLGLTPAALLEVLQSWGVEVSWLDLS